MSFNGSFGDGQFDLGEIDDKKNNEENTEEIINSIDINDLNVDENNDNNNENNLSFDKLVVNNDDENNNKSNNPDLIPQDNEIFNNLCTKSIDFEDNSKQNFYSENLVKTKINYELNNLFNVLQNNIKNKKMKFYVELENKSNKQYSKLVRAEILYLNINTKLYKIMHIFKKKLFKKKSKFFRNLKSLAKIKKYTKMQENKYSKEKENKIGMYREKLKNLENNLKDILLKVNNLKKQDEKIDIENIEVNQNILKLNEKVNNLINIGKNLRNNIIKKRENNISDNSKSTDNIIQHLEEMIQQKQKDKERAMIDVDNFYNSMDAVLSQYEALSENILCNGNINK